MKSMLVCLGMVVFAVASGPVMGQWGTWGCVPVGTSVFSQTRTYSNSVSLTQGKDVEDAIAYCAKVKVPLFVWVNYENKDVLWEYPYNRHIRVDGFRGEVDPGLIILRPRDGSMWWRWRIPSIQVDRSVVESELVGDWITDFPVEKIEKMPAECCECSKDCKCCNCKCNDKKRCSSSCKCNKECKCSSGCKCGEGCLCSGAELSCSMNCTCAKRSVDQEVISDGDPFPTGVIPDRLCRETERILLNGTLITAEEGINRIGDIPDKSKYFRIIVISPNSELRNKVRAELSALPEAKDAIVQSYSPDHWHLKDREGNTKYKVDGGDPIIYYLAPSSGNDPAGRVINRQDHYKGGVSVVAESLRKARKDYDAGKDPDNSKPKLPEPPMPPGPYPNPLSQLPGWVWMVAILGVVIFLLRRSKS